MPQTIGMDNDLDQALAAVGPRLANCAQRETTLAGLSAATGISVSTLSRPESGARRPTLELPHWFGGTGTGSVEFLSLFGTQGERAHLRARPRTKQPAGRPG